MAIPPCCPATTDAFNQVFQREPIEKDDCGCRTDNCCWKWRGGRCDALGMAILMGGVLVPTAPIVTATIYCNERPKMKWRNGKFKCIDICFVSICSPLGMAIKTCQCASGVICPFFIFQEEDLKIKSLSHKNISLPLTQNYFKERDEKELPLIPLVDLRSMFPSSAVISATASLSLLPYPIVPGTPAFPEPARSPRIPPTIMER